MENVDEKGACAEEERGGASGRTAVTSDGKPREGTCAEAEHRGHHSKVHKSSGGHKQRKKRSGSSGHTEHSRSRSRRDSHSHTRHPGDHQPELEASTGRHATGGQHSRSSKASSSTSASKEGRIKTKSKKSPKTSSSSSHGSGKDRSKRENSDSKKSSWTEVGPEIRSSSPSSTSTRKSTSGRIGPNGSTTEDNTVPEGNADNSRSLPNSRSNSHESRGGNSRHNSSERGSAEQDCTVTTACGTTGAMAGIVPVDPPILSPTAARTAILHLGQEKKELLPLPPLPKAAAAAAAALQEQCSKKKGQQAKAVKRASASSGGASLSSQETVHESATETGSTAAAERPTSQIVAKTPCATTTSAVYTFASQRKPPGGFETVALREKPHQVAPNTVVSVVLGGEGDAGARQTYSGEAPPEAETSGEGVLLQRADPPQSLTDILPSSKTSEAPAHWRKKTAEQTPRENGKTLSPPGTRSTAADIGTQAEGHSGSKACGKALETESLIDKEAQVNRGVAESGMLMGPPKVSARKRPRSTMVGGTVRAAVPMLPLQKKENEEAAGATQPGAVALMGLARPAVTERLLAPETAPMATQLPGTAVCAGRAPLSEVAASASPQGVQQAKRTLQEGRSREEPTAGKYITEAALTVAAAVSSGPNQPTSPATAKTVKTPTYAGVPKLNGEHAKKDTVATKATEEVAGMKVAAKGLVTSGAPRERAGSTGVTATKKPEKGTYRKKDKCKKAQPVYDAHSRGRLEKTSVEVDDEGGREEGQLTPSKATREEVQLPAVAEGAKEVPLKEAETAEREISGAEWTQDDETDAAGKEKQTDEGTVVGDILSSVVGSAATQLIAVEHSTEAPSGLGKDRTRELEKRCASGQEAGGAAENGALPGIYTRGAAVYEKTEDPDPCSPPSAASDLEKSHGCEEEGSGASKESSDADEPEEKAIDRHAPAAAAGEPQYDTAAVPEVTEELVATGEESAGERPPEEEVEEEAEESSEEEADASDGATEGSSEGEIGPNETVPRATVKQDEDYEGRDKLAELGTGDDTSATGLQRSGGTEALPDVHLKSTNAGTPAGEATKIDQPTPTLGADGLKVQNEHDGAEDDRENDEGLPADAAGHGRTDDAASLISSLAASPSHYYSPSGAEGSGSSSPDSPTEAAPLDWGSAAEHEQEGTPTRAPHAGAEHISKKAENAAAEKVVAESDQPCKIVNVSAKGVDEAKKLHCSPSAGGKVEKALGSNEAATTETFSAADLVAAGESVGGAAEKYTGDVGLQAMAGKELEVPQSVLVPETLTVPKADSEMPMGSDSTAHPSAVTERSTGEAPGKTQTEARTQQTAVLEVGKSRGSKTEDAAMTSRRGRQRSLALTVPPRSKYWGEGLNLWKMLLRCEQEAYDVADLRVLGNFACCRAEFVSVSSGCVGQPERAGDAADMVQQQEKLFLDLQAVHSKLQEGMGRGGSSSGAGKRRPGRMQQTLISLERRMKEELSQIDQLLQLQSLQHFLHQQREKKGGYRIERISGFKPSSSSEGPSSDNRTERGTSLNVSYRSGSIGSGENDLRGVYSGMGLLQVMSSSPVCWYVHDVVGMVCRRRSGGPFPERWEEYKEWYGELVLEDVYITWNAIVAQRGKTVKKQLQSTASAGATVICGSEETSAENAKAADVVVSGKDETGQRTTLLEGKKEESNSVEEEGERAGATRITESSGLEDSRQNTAEGAAAGTVGEPGTASEVSKTSKNEERTEEAGKRQQAKSEGTGSTGDSPLQQQVKKPAASVKQEASNLTEKRVATENQKSKNTLGHEANNSETVGAVAQPFSIDAGGAQPREGEETEEQGTLPSRKRKRAESVARFPPVKGSIVCCNEEMMKHLVLLPCKAFLAERFFLAVPEKKVLSFGTGNLRQRVGAMRLRRSWRLAPLLKQQELLKEQQVQMGHQMQNHEQQKEGKQEQQGATKVEADAGTKTETKGSGAPSSTASTAVQQIDRGQIEAAAQGSTNRGTGRTESACGEQVVQQQQTVEPGTKLGEETTALLEGEAGEEKRDTSAKRQKKDSGEGLAGEPAPSPEGGSPKDKAKEQCKRTVPGTEAKLIEDASLVKRASAVDGAGVVVRSTVPKDYAQEGRRVAETDTSNTVDLGPEVVAVINLCMTERYYSLPELRAQGIESYWLRVDGSGELPTERVVCLFFRLLAFITHKYAKLKKQQQNSAAEAGGGGGLSTTIKTWPAVTDHAAGGVVSAEHAHLGSEPKGSSRTPMDVDAGASYRHGAPLNAEDVSEQSAKIEQEIPGKTAPTAGEAETGPGSTATKAAGGGSQDAEKFTVLVHCTNGVNRTGLFIALLLMNLMGCECNFALKTFSDARGTPVTKEMFKRWLRSEEAKGLPKMYREALQAPVLQGRILAYKQREQRLLEQKLRKESDKEKVLSKCDAHGKGVMEKKQLQRARKQVAQEEKECHVMQQQQEVAGDEGQKIMKLQRQESCSVQKSTEAAVALKGTAIAHRKQQQRLKATTGNGSKEKLAQDGGPEKESLQKQTKVPLKKKPVKSKHVKQLQQSPQRPSKAQEQTQPQLSQQEQGVTEEQGQQKLTDIPKGSGEEPTTTGEEDLTIPTPFGLINALEMEKSLEMNKEARLSARLKNAIAAREKERQRILAALRAPQKRKLFEIEKQQQTCISPHSSATTTNPVDRRYFKGTIEGKSAAEVTSKPEQVNMQTAGTQASQQQSAATSQTEQGGACGGEEAKGQEGYGKQKLMDLPAASKEAASESEHNNLHKTPEVVDSLSQHVKQNAASGALGETLFERADAEVPHEAGDALTTGDSGAKKEARTGALTITAGKSPDEGLSQSGGGDGLSGSAEDARLEREALEAMESSFQAEIDVLEDLRNQARATLQEIPQMPPRLPLDGIVLVGPVQNALLAPEELLLQLLAGCPTLKIESLDILVGRPGRGSYLDADVITSAAAEERREETLTVAGNAGEQEVLRKGAAVTGLVERQSPPSTGTGRSSVERQPTGTRGQEHELLYKPVWPERVFPYPAPLIPIETKKRNKAANVGYESERVKREESSSASMRGKSADGRTQLSQRKRRREQLGKDNRKAESCTQDRNGSPPQERASCETVTEDTCSSDDRTVEGRVIQEKATQEQLRGTREGRAEPEHQGILHIEGQQRTPAVLHVAEGEGNSRAAVVLQTTTIQKSQSAETVRNISEAKPSQLLDTVNRLTSVGTTLEVIEEEAEEGLEAEESVSPGASPPGDSSSPQLHDEEDGTDTGVVGGTQSAPDPADGSLAAPGEDEGRAKKQRVEMECGVPGQEASVCAASAVCTTEPPKPADIPDIPKHHASASELPLSNASEHSVKATGIAGPPTSVVKGNDKGKPLQGGAGADVQTSTPAGESGGLPRDKSGSEEDRKDSAEERQKPRAVHSGVTLRTWYGIAGRVRASEFSLKELQSEGKGLFSQRELALRLLDYHDEDDLRLCYVARIQCADEASFLYLLSHQFQRMRQQPVRLYPSFCYPTLYSRGKRLDRQILAHAKALVLAANAPPAVCAAVQAAATARQGEVHDFIWLLGSAGGRVAKGKNATGRSTAVEAENTPPYLGNRSQHLRRGGGATHISPAYMFHPSLRFMPLRMSAAIAADRGRSPFASSRSLGAIDSSGFYGAAALRGAAGALGRLGPLSSPSMNNAVSRFAKPFFSSKLAFFGSAVASELGRGPAARPLSPASPSRGGVARDHNARDLGYHWPPFVPFSMRAGAPGRALMCDSATDLFEERKLYHEEAAPPPPPGFVYFSGTAGASTQRRRFRSLGPSLGSRAPTQIRSPHELLTATLPGSGVATAALKLRRPIVSRSNLAAHRREALLLGNRTRALSAGAGGATTLPAHARRASSVGALYSAAGLQTPRGLGNGAQAGLGGEVSSSTKRALLNKCGLGRGGRRDEERATAAGPAMPGVMNELHPQSGFPMGGSPSYPLPPPAPSLEQFYLGTSVPPDRDLALPGGRLGGQSNLHANYVDMEGGGSPPRLVGFTRYGVDTGMNQQGDSTCGVWVTDSTGSGNAVTRDTNQQQRGAGRSCMYIPVEGEEDTSEVAGMFGSGGLDARTGMWGLGHVEGDTSGGHDMSYGFRNQPAGKPGRSQDLTGGMRTGQGRVGRGGLQTGDRKKRSQQRISPSEIAGALQRAPPPPPPLLEGGGVSGRDAGTGGARGGLSTWGESTQLGSCPGVGGAWISNNGGGIGNPEQQQYQQLSYQQQRGIGVGATAAGGIRARHTGWTEEGNTAATCISENQRTGLWDGGQRSLEGVPNVASGGAGGPEGNKMSPVGVGRLQQQTKMQSSYAQRMQAEAMRGGGSVDKEREAAGVMWAHQQRREEAGMSGGSTGIQSGKPLSYSQQAVRGPPLLRLQDTQQPQNMRGAQVAAGRGMPGGSATERGTSGDSIVSDAAARAAAAMLACQQQQLSKGTSKGGAADAWPPQASAWESDAGARAFRPGSGPATLGGEQPYGRGDGSCPRPFGGGETGGTRNGSGEGSATGRAVLLEATAACGGAATRGMRGGGPLGLSGQPTQQQGFFRAEQEQRGRATAVEVTSADAATAAESGNKFATGDTVSGDRGLLLRGEESDNNRGSARSSALVGGGVRLHGAPAATAVPSRGGSGTHADAATVAGTHSFNFPGGRQTAQGDVTSTGSSPYSREVYPSFSSRPPYTGYGVEGKPLQAKGPDMSNREGSVTDHLSYQGGAGNVNADSDRMQQKPFNNNHNNNNSNNGEFSALKRGGPGADGWAQRMSAAPLSGRGGYGRGRPADVTTGLSVGGTATSSSSSMPQYSRYTPVRLGSGAGAAAGHQGMMPGDKGRMHPGLRGGLTGEGFGYSGSSAVVPAPGTGAADSVEGRDKGAGLRPAVPGGGELGCVGGMSTTAEGAQPPFAPRAGSNQGRRPGEQPVQARGEAARGGNIMGAAAIVAGPAGRFSQGNGRRFNPVQRKGPPTGGGPPLRRAGGGPPPPPQWTIQRLFQAAGAPRPPATGTGVEQQPQQPGSGMSWDNTSRATTGGGTMGRVVAPCVAAGPAEGAPLGTPALMHQQQQHALLAKQKPGDWGGALGHAGDGSGLLWPSKIPPEGVMSASATGGQQPNTQNQQQQTAMMIQFAQQLALMQQQQQQPGLAGSAARGTSVDSFPVATNPLASLIGNFQQGGTGLTVSSMSQQQLQQQLLMMCVLQQQQQQQQAGNNAPIPGMSAVDLQQLMLYTQYYSMLLSGMSEQQATATVQAQQLLQRQQDEIMKQQLLHQSIQQQQQLQLSLAGLGPSPAAPLGALGDPCKGPPTA